MKPGVRVRAAGWVSVVGLAVLFGCAGAGATSSPPPAVPKAEPPGAAETTDACAEGTPVFYSWKQHPEGTGESTDAGEALTIHEGGLWQFESADPAQRRSGCLSEETQRKIERAISSATLSTEPVASGRELGHTQEGCAGLPYAVIELTVRGVRLVWATDCTGNEPHASLPPLIDEVRDRVGLR
jgi:hypothetical protein